MLSYSSEYWRGRLRAVRSCTDFSCVLEQLKSSVIAASRDGVDTAKLCWLLDQVSKIEVSEIISVKLAEIFEMEGELVNACKLL